MSEWLNLLLRWVHVLAGISWIGSSFYFMWLDSSLEKPAQKSPEDRNDTEGFLWMVHSGGFYRVEKKHLTYVPPNLHWFKWEAAFTWLSGFFLLLVVYYWGGILIDSVESRFSETQAMGIGIGLLIISWAIYDLLWVSPLAKNPMVANGISFLLFVLLAYVSTSVFAGRAAYIHVGAVLGTLMVANVWMRIIPAQRDMLAATAAGTKRDMRLAARAKMRSVHNHYMTFPVVFIMLGNHFPSTYGSEHNAALLIGVVIFSVAVKYAMNHFPAKPAPQSA